MKPKTLSKTRRSRLIHGVVALAISLSTPFFSHSASFNFGSDFEAVTNPSGPWRVWTSSGNETPIFRTTDPWETPQVSLGETPGVFKSNGTEQFPHAWQANDMVARTSPIRGESILITWVPTQAYSQVKFSVQLWPGTPDGPMPWFQLNVSPWGVAEFGNLSEFGTFDRDHPYQISGALGALNVGNDVSLLLDRGRNGPLDGYVGFSFTVETTPIPEPSNVASVVGMLLLATQLARRQKMLLP